MRNVTVFILLVSNWMFSQQIILKFVNDDHSYHGKDRNDIGNYSHTINDIVMKDDLTFEFDSRPMHSCSTWKNYKGTYKVLNDTIIFKDNYKVEEDDVRVFLNRTSDEFYLLKFNTDRNSILKNRSIRIEVEYDFDSKIDRIDKTYEIDLNNEVKIFFKDIPHLEKVANLRIEYFLNSSEKRIKYITENNVVNVRNSELPNHIEVQFIEKPRIEAVYRESKFLRKNKKLIFLSSFRNKIDLIDYHKVLEFEKEYTLKEK